MAKQKKAQITESAPRYCMILKYINPIVEIETTDYILCFDEMNPSKYFLEFFDTNGRYWYGLRDDFIIIDNYPDALVDERFEKLKLDAKRQFEMKSNQSLKLAHDPMMG